MRPFSRFAVLTLLCILCFFNVANADDDWPEHKLVIQVSSDDHGTQSLALSNVVNVQKLYGIDNVSIEVVAYGPGLSLVTKSSEFSQRVESLVFQDVVFTACMNTMDTIKAKTGEHPVLSEGVTTVTAGVARLMELQEEGWSYVRP